MTQYSEKLLNTVFNKTRETSEELHIMKFLKYNKWIKDKKTLIQEIPVACAISGKRNIDQMAQLMFIKQTDVLTTADISLEACRSYIEELFVDKSMKGYQMEKECITWLRMTCKKDYIWELASDELDTKYNVDIVGTLDDKVIHIQVKPESYRNCDAETKAINNSKEKGLGAKIHYIYYDKDERFSS